MNLALMLKQVPHHLNLCAQIKLREFITEWEEQAFENVSVGKECAHVTECSS